MADNHDHMLSRTMSASEVSGIMDRAASVFNALDLDKDGILDSTEIQSVQDEAKTNGVMSILDACNSSEGQFTMSEIDQNKDGKLSAAEFTKYFMKIFTVSGPDKALAILSKLDADLLEIGR
ncbi:hypothetical protein CYMTET_54167 [Cymbomonas tetramitiformis]|uniref:EF-hand domain-containing protein n=1 Tax=Cymbomonas tetramitiformis TaxID=36881 RepID=A0AAE0BH83_9CHLO|nr:hypothetical protein CYMTET_54167 [Cymbomonas tetramitiformis]